MAIPPVGLESLELTHCPGDSRAFRGHGPNKKTLPVNFPGCSSAGTMKSRAKLAAPSDIKQRFRTDTLTTTSGHCFQIRSVPAVDVMMKLASLIDMQFDFTDADAMKESLDSFLSKLNPSLIFEQWFLEFVRWAVMQGVSSVRFVAKVQDQCLDDELSVGLLDLRELIELAGAVIGISFGIDGDVFGRDVAKI